MNLSDHPYFPYPRDRLTRFGFVVGDAVSGSLTPFDPLHQAEGDTTVLGSGLWISA